MSCYTCENCITGNYNNCKNNAIGGRVTIPISIDNNRNSRSVQSTENDEYEMADLIAEGTILAVYTDESDSNYYLFRASSCPQVLTKDTTDDWGITYGKGSKIVHGCYFDRTRKLLSFKLLGKIRSIISVASIIYISPILQCLNGALNLTETTHLDILSVLDEMEV